MENVTIKQLRDLISKQGRSDVLYSIEHGQMPVLSLFTLLDDEVIQLLPPVLIKMLGEPESDIKRDLRLVALIVLLSGVFPNTIGIYDNAEVRANLNLFVCGPFAVGKGELNRIKVWVELIDKHFETLYKQEMVEYKQALKDGVEDLQKPLRKWLFIPADNSKSGFIELLAQ